MQNYFKTKDFYLSAYLIINSIELISCIHNSGISQFEFPESVKLNELISAFYSMRGNCDALTYAGAVRNLKSIIYNAKSESNSISISKHEGLNHEFHNKTRGTL